MGKVHSFSEELLDIWLRDPGDHEVRLLTQNPTLDEVTPAVEMTDTLGYTAITASNANFEAAGTTTVAKTFNSATISFTASGGDWPDITGVALHRMSDGQLVHWDSFGSPPKDVNDGETLKFNAGGLSISEA